MTVTIPLFRSSLSTVVDDQDCDLVKGYLWRRQHGHRTPYAIATIPRSNPKRHVLLHRVILGIVDDLSLHCDHINGNGLDNTRKNLRVCTVAENNRNVQKQRSYGGHPPSSSYKGVSWNKREHRWTAHGCYQRKQYHLGTFVTELEAALAYNAFARAHHGTFAQLNELDD